MTEEPQGGKTKPQSEVSARAKESRGSAGGGPQRPPEGARPLTVAGEEVWALPERALYWPAGETLVVADCHWGKAATFRTAGLAVPDADTADDLARLDRALESCGARRLVVLGDFFHARSSRSPETLDALGRWRRRHPALDISLVRGNHDRHAGDPPPPLAIECREEPWTAGPWAYRHFPEETAAAYTLAGHLHPAARLRGAGDRLRLPCFHFGATVAVLPAFGSFTGSRVIRPRSGDRVLVIAEGRVLPVG